MIGLETGERVVMVVRRHWFLFALDVVMLFLIGIAPLVLFAFVPESARMTLPGNAGELGVFFYSLWLLFLWVALFVRWTDYYLDIWIVTDRRVIDVNQRGLFNRETTTANLNRIQDVTIDVRGLFATLLGYGDVRLETAGAASNHIVIRTARDPQGVKEVILRAEREFAPQPTI